MLSLKKGTSSDDSSHTIVENDIGIPDLSVKCTAGGAAIVGDFVYLVAGQVEDEDGNKAASRIVFRLDLLKLEPSLDLIVNDQTSLIVSRLEKGLDS